LVWVSVEDRGVDVLVGCVGFAGLGVFDGAVGGTVVPLFSAAFTFTSTIPLVVVF
jgi:exosortase/archaeosortase